MKQTKGEKIFNVINIIFFVIVAVAMIVPVFFILKKSLDLGGQGELGISLIPKKFSILYYKMILEDKGIYRPFFNSVLITVVGTLLSLVINSMGAYTLSRRDLRGNKFFVYFMVIVPMLFSGGMMPSYLLMKELHLINKLSALVIPALASGWNMILIRNYYWSIPESLIESAKIDGAEEFTVFFRITLPLSKPVLAAIALFTGVAFWNTFFSAVLYINDPSKYVFPVKLRELIAAQQDTQAQFENALQSAGEDIALKNMNMEGLSSAMIVVSIVPVIIIYPYLQKYFASGLMVGSVKG